MDLDYRPPVRNGSTRPNTLWDWVGFAVILLALSWIFLSLVVIFMSEWHPRVPRTQATAQLMGLSTALEAYYSVYLRYPTTSEGLVALTMAKPPFLIGPVKKDPWGNAYRYVSPAGGERGFRISSDGPDGVAGTGDDLVVR